MSHDIDCKYVKISGLMEVSEIFEVDDDVIVSLKGSIVKAEQRSNQDGTLNLIWTVKPTENQVKKA